MDTDILAHMAKVTWGIGASTGVVWCGMNFFGCRLLQLDMPCRLKPGSQHLGSALIPESLCLCAGFLCLQPSF